MAPKSATAATTAAATKAGTRSASAAKKGGRPRSTKRRYVKNEGIIPLLALASREVEASAQRGKATPLNRTKFHVVALLMREELARVKDNPEVSEAEREETLKRLDGVAAVLVKTAAKDTSLIQLLEPETPITEATLQLKRKMMEQAGLEAPEETPTSVAAATVPAEFVERQVVPAGIAKRKLANPFQAPILETPKQPQPVVHLANWELLNPLLKSFEQGSTTAATMQLPEPPVNDRISPVGLALMPHQARFLASVAAGHRSFLLADEPGLGKTAQSLLAASVSDSYPLLVVAPNVVKMNWAREAKLWTPSRRVTVVHGDGADVDPFADIFIINYDILDRHLSWLAAFGFKGMVVDEAHMIKNVQSNRSRNVLNIAERIRERVPGHDPLLIALTGTPLINDIDDFLAIWRFLGWIDEKQPAKQLLAQLEANGFTPADAAFYPSARQAVVDLGIVRRRKVDVAKDLPEKQVIDLPVELDGALAPEIKSAEQRLADRLCDSFSRLKAGKLGATLSDEQLIRMVCLQEFDEDGGSGEGVNVFSLVRQIGTAKAQLAADYTAQLVRSVGKVVFFAKHVDVMDQVIAALADRGLKTVSIRGEQSAQARQEAVDAFNNDPDVHVIVCSLTAAGVGVNLQASSNVVLAELSWTDAEQTQAIDRVHRIGQEEPVTAWRIVAAQTVDQRIAELIDAKAGLAARALDGAVQDEENSDPVQLGVLMQLLRAEIERRGLASDAGLHLGD